MTKIATDFASKFAVAFVAVAMIFAAYAPAAQAQSSEDLQQMINDLLAQVAQLQAGTGSAVSAGECSAHFFMDHGIGSTGAEVMALQVFLNKDADTRVAVSGVGSAGMESSYYGALTAAAVSKFQVKYRAEILSPLGLVNPTGYWGASSRALANAQCATGEETEEGEEEEGEEEGEEEEDEDFTLGGEASLDAFEIDDAEDDNVEEGDEDVEIGMFTVEFTNGDAEISRMDIALLKNGQNNTNTSEPWEAFDTISLWVDGDMIAEVDASDEDDYLDEDDGTLRFSNLDIIAEEDEEVEIIVAASVQGNLDSAELGNWELFATSLRFFDADGVATTIDSEEDIEEVDADMSNNPSASFEVEVEGAGDDLMVRTSSEDPEATTLPLMDDENTEFVSFAFEFDADDSESDIEVNSFILGANVLSSTSAAVDATTIIDDIKVFVDGDEVSTDDVTVSNTDLDANNNGQITVDFDNEFFIDAEETVTVEIEVEYKSLSTMNEGTTVQFTLDGDDVDAEGADDITVDGSATGDEHTLRTEGVILEMTSEDFSLKANSTTDANDDEGVYTFKFDVTAFEEDFYFNKTAARGTTTDDTAGAEFTIESGSATVISGTTSASLTSNASTEGARFVVREGETKTFTLKVNFDPVAGGFYAVQLENVNYFMSSTGTAAEMQAAIPAEDFETDEYSI